MSSPFHRPDEPKEISEVNVVPLADVSLVLLIILLLLSPMMTQSMLKVKTASRDSSAPPIQEPIMPPPQEVVLAVAVTPQGFSVGDRTFSSKQELKLFLQDELLRRTDKKVFVTPHPDVAHGDVVDALELVKESGAESVALVQTQEDDGEVRPAAPAPQHP